MGTTDATIIAVNGAPRYPATEHTRSKNCALEESWSKRKRMISSKRDGCTVARTWLKMRRRLAIVTSDVLPYAARNLSSCSWMPLSTPSVCSDCCRRDVAVAAKTALPVVVAAVVVDGRLDDAVRDAKPPAAAAAAAVVVLAAAAVAVAMVMTALVISTTERGLPPLAPYTPSSSSAPSERL